MDTGFKYRNQEPIYCNDMVRFDDGDIGFVFYNEAMEAWSVKHYDIKTGQAALSSLKSVHSFIKEMVI